MKISTSNRIVNLSNPQENLVSLLSDFITHCKRLSLQWKEILNAEEASIYLGIEVDTLRQYASRKLIPYYKPNRKLIYFRRTDLDNWITSVLMEAQRDLDQEALDYVTSKGALK